MYKFIAGLLIILTPALSQAQFGNMLKKAKNTVGQRIENNVDKEVNKTLDQLEGKSSSAPANNTGTAPVGAKPAATVTAPPAAAKPEKETVKSFSRFDFVPGERVIYAEDFAQDAIGELPLTWNASGK
ncbi:MAG TPA: hypothetical protein VEX65_05075, partial [Flavisolibacter sp.]|nr:hypothetical protein [Flavisolibacter sp.]